MVLPSRKKFAYFLFSIEWKKLAEVGQSTDSDAEDMKKFWAIICLFENTKGRRPLWWKLLIYIHRYPLLIWETVQRNNNLLFIIFNYAKVERNNSYVNPMKKLLMQIYSRNIRICLHETRWNYFDEYQKED